MSEPVIDRADKRAALQRILDSSEFAGAERLKAFLAYVVEQDLEGRADTILGKTILEDVYRKGPGLDGNPENVVRVDATRLRQRLELYYGGGGKDDPIRIHIDKGGYAPRYARRTIDTPEEQTGKPQRPTRLTLRVIVGCALLGIVSISAYFAMSRTEIASPALETTPEARSTLFENSPTTLLARNMVEEARGLLFPAAELVRVSSALDMFKEAIRLDPSYYGGFAGASQAAITLAGLTPDPEKRAIYLNEAEEFAERALALDRTKAWGHSAKALVSMIQQDYASAEQSSLTAIQLEPSNLHVLEIDAIVAFFSGDFDRTIRSADPRLHKDRIGYGLPWRNALGNAYFHIGAYEDSVRTLTEAVRIGDPVSEINTAHLIAAYEASGQHEEAAELVMAFENSWPESRLSLVLRNLFQNPENAENVLSRMTAAGWEDPTIQPQ